MAPTKRRPLPWPSDTACWAPWTTSGDQPRRLYWADLGAPSGSRPAKRRPILVVQSNPYNASRLATVLTAVITSNTDLAAMPGNVFLPATATGLPRDSVVNVTALVTLNKTDLTDRIGEVPPSLMHEVDRGLRRVLEL